MRLRVLTSEPERALAVLDELAGRAILLDIETDGDTTYLCTAGIDRDGRRIGVSLIQSNASGFGSHLVEPNTGINLHNRGIGFNLREGHPAEFGAEIARDIGAFWTKGLPCDTKAFDYRILSDEHYVGQAELLLAEVVAEDVAVEHEGDVEGTLQGEDADDRTSVTSHARRNAG